MASSIPGAVSYFLNLATTTLSASTDTPNNSHPYVWFGAQLAKYIAPVNLQVKGVTDIVHEWAELGSHYKVEETYRIQCQLVSNAGDLDFEQRMVEVFDNFLLLTVALGNDYTMGGNVRLCLPACEGEVMPASTQAGSSMCSLMFFIHCEARIQTLS
jgi:hypothetical protein